MCEAFDRSPPLLHSGHEIKPAPQWRIWDGPAALPPSTAVCLVERKSGARSTPMAPLSTAAVATLGIDIGKNVFHLIGLTQRGATSGSVEQEKGTKKRESMTNGN